MTSNSILKSNTDGIGRNCRVGANRLSLFAMSLLLVAALLPISNVIAQSKNASDEAVEMEESQSVRGVIRPEKQATLATKISAMVKKVGFEEGARFKKGDMLIALDCEIYENELVSAKSKQREMQVLLDSALYLQKHNAGSIQEVNVALARVDGATAESEVIYSRIDQCKIRAPFNGSVAEKNISIHEMTVPGKPLMNILSSGEHSIELIVPSTWLTWLSPGAQFQFLVDETGKSYAASVNRVGSVVDSVSQTIKVFGKFGSLPSEILPGMSGSANFKHDGG